MSTTRRALLGGATSLALTGCATSQREDAVMLTTAMDGKAVPGMAALTIVNFQSQPELTAGVRRIGSADRVRPGDRWHLGSDGKAMTATMIARLVERGALAWDARLEQMLPDLVGVMREEYRDVTLPDLLSHRAGLPENVGGGDLTFFNSFYREPAPLTQQRIRYISAGLAEAPVGPKRADDAYSNTGYVIAAAAAERATGQSFEALIRAEVFEPLRLQSARLGHYGEAGEPVGHVDGRVADREFDANPPMFTPPGGCRMSLQDWSRFCVAHMRGERGGSALLSAETFRFLHTPQGDSNAALGWGVQARAAGREGRALVHSGSDGNWFALVVIFPDQGVGALVAANAAESMGGDAATVAALRSLVSTLPPLD